MLKVVEYKEKGGGGGGRWNERATENNEAKTLLTNLVLLRSTQPD